MLVVPEQTYPLICVAVSKGTELNQVVRFGTVNPNSTSSWFTEAGESTDQPGAELTTLLFLKTKCSVLVFAPCRHTADVRHPRHSARKRHYPGLPGQ